MKHWRTSVLGDETCLVQTVTVGDDVAGSVVSLVGRRPPLPRLLARAALLGTGHRHQGPRPLPRTRPDSVPCTPIPSTATQPPYGSSNDTASSTSVRSATATTNTCCSSSTTRGREAPQGDQPVGRRGSSSPSSSSRTMSMCRVRAVAVMRTRTQAARIRRPATPACPVGQGSSRQHAVGGGVGAGVESVIGWWLVVAVMSSPRTVEPGRNCLAAERLHERSGTTHARRFHQPQQTRSLMRHWPADPPAQALSFHSTASAPGPAWRAASSSSSAYSMSVPPLLPSCCSLHPSCAGRSAVTPDCVSLHVRRRARTHSHPVSGPVPRSPPPPPPSTVLAERRLVHLDGWDFSWLDGRATEQRPSWGYARAMADRLARAGAALDIQTGGGEVLAAAPTLPPVTVATESWPPNVARATALLHPRGAVVVADAGRAAAALRRRRLRPGGQPASGDDLVGRDRPGPGPRRHVLLPAGRTGQRRSSSSSTSSARSPPRSAAPATPTRPRRRRGRRAGRGRTCGPSGCAIEFFDIGAVVYFLRKVIWMVPGSSSTPPAPTPVLHRQIEGKGPFVAHSKSAILQGAQAGRAIRPACSARPAR